MPDKPRVNGDTFKLGTLHHEVLPLAVYGFALDCAVGYSYAESAVGDDVLFLYPAEIILTWRGVQGGAEGRVEGDLRAADR